MGQRCNGRAINGKIVFFQVYRGPGWLCGARAKLQTAATRLESEATPRLPIQGAGAGRPAVLRDEASRQVPTLVPRPWLRRVVPRHLVLEFEIGKCVSFKFGGPLRSSLPWPTVVHSISS